MKRLWNSHRATVLMLLGALAVSAFSAGCASTAPPSTDGSELLALGFKVLVATTPVQKDWVQSLTPGQMRPMQRNEKKYFVYPDAARNQIYVGGPQEYQAYLELHPDKHQGTQEAADRAYRARQDDAMRKATARDLSDPFLGVGWVDLGW